MSARSLLVAAVAPFVIAAACGSAASRPDAAAPSPAPDAAGPRRMSGDDAVARVLEAVRALPEVKDLERRMVANDGKLVAMLETDPAEVAPEVWRVYVGESRPDHLARLWSFAVDAETGAMTIEDPATLEARSFEDWRKALAASPP